MHTITPLLPVNFSLHSRMHGPCLQSQRRQEEDENDRLLSSTPKSYFGSIVASVHPDFIDQSGNPP